MSDGSKASKDVHYLFPLAEKELRAFVHAVDQLFGTEQARQSGIAWIHEMEVMNWPLGELIPNWRKATIRASAQICSPHCANLRLRATKIGATDTDKKNRHFAVSQRRLKRMRADIVAGAVFPDYELTDHTGKHRKLSDLQGPAPLILVLSRGGYCPKDRRQAEGLVQLHHEMEVGYSRLVTISTDNMLLLKTAWELGEHDRFYPYGKTYAQVFREQE